MSGSGPKSFTRRRVLAGMLAASALFRGASSATSQPNRPAPASLGHGLEVRDFRLFPTKDVPRFIVEIHNTSDTAVDTPTVGVVLPHLDDRGNFGWANPVSPVLHPHTSDCLIGVAPGGVLTNDDWGTPDWTLCRSIGHEQAESIQDWQFEFSHVVETPDPLHASTTVEVTNLNSTARAQLHLQGLLWDADGRLAGALLPISLAGVQPGETEELVVHSIPGSTFLANPFVLLESVEGVETTLSLQPRGLPINKNCNVVMPWNRDD